MAEGVVLHLVLGDHAGATLRVALRARGEPGEVHVIPDDLGHGPLDDGVARVEHMKRCCAGGFEWTHVEPDAFTAWRDLESRCRTARGRLVVWRGLNVSETILVAMACWWLRESSVAIEVMDMPDTATGHTHVGTRATRELVEFLEMARPLSRTELDGWSAMFEGFRHDGGGRRLWLDGGVRSAPLSVLDKLVLGCVGRHWTSAARIVGEAMGRANPRDGVSDVFVSSRLQALIAAGQIEADGPRTVLRDYRVRLSAQSAD